MKKIHKVIISICSIIIVILSVVVSILSITESQEHLNNETPTITTTKSPFIVETQEDKYGRILSKSVYDKETKLTYVYTYNYTYDGGQLYCTSAYVMIVDARGKILSSSVE